MRYDMAKKVITIIGVAGLTLPTIYLAGYLLRVDVVRGPLVTSRFFQSDFEMRLYAPLIKIEDDIREMLFPKRNAKAQIRTGPDF
jgi:hypothetical protein